MKVFLLRQNQDQSVFYAEPEVSDQSPEAVDEQESGVLALLGKKYNDLQRTLRESEGGIGLRMRRIWEWLHRRTSPDETLIRSLRGASAIHLYHPSELDSAQARAEWESYLRRRRRYFTLWLIVNALITPLTLLMAPIPGPNIIGYWFTYRAICHALALLGIRRAGEVELETQEASAFNFYLDEAAGEQISEAAQVYGLNELESYVARLERKESVAEAGKLTVSS